MWVVLICLLWLCKKMAVLKEKAGSKVNDACLRLKRLSFRGVNDYRLQSKKALNESAVEFGPSKRVVCYGLSIGLLRANDAFAPSFRCVYLGLLCSYHVMFITLLITMCITLVFIHKIP